jgi:hypothetical protein
MAIPGGRLKGKVAVVTASTQGIGFGIAERLGLEGASVVISSRKQVLAHLFFLYISYMQGFRVEYLFAGEVGQTQEIISSYFIAKFDLRCELVSWLTDLVCVTLNIRNSGEPILFFILLMSSVCNLSLYKIAAQMYRTGSYFMLKIFVRVRPLHVNHCCLSITSIKTSTPP